MRILVYFFLEWESYTQYVNIDNSTKRNVISIESFTEINLFIPELFRHASKPSPTKRLYKKEKKKKESRFEGSISEKCTIPNPLESPRNTTDSSRGRENTFSSNRASSRYVYIRLRIMVEKRRRSKEAFSRRNFSFPETRWPFPRNKFFPTLRAQEWKKFAWRGTEIVAESFSNPSFNAGRNGFI